MRSIFTHSETGIEPLALTPVHTAGNARAHVIFVHGLGGDSITTWMATADQNYFWPSWLSTTIDDISILTLSYPADKTTWGNSGGDMALQTRARSVLDLMVSSGTLKSTPIIFVCHSLGGLLVKQLLQSAVILGNKKWKPIADKVAGIAFLATPHTGAALANLASALPFIGLSNCASQLKANEPYLMDLSSWFRAYTDSKDLCIGAYYETMPLVQGSVVVGAASSDPGIRGCTPVSVDADHLTICKPRTVKAPIYMSICEFINDVLKDLVLNDRLGADDGGSPTRDVMTFSNTTKVDEESINRLLTHRRDVKIAYYEDVSEALSKVDRRYSRPLEFIAKTRIFQKTKDRRDQDRIAADWRKKIEIFRRRCMRVRDENENALKLLLEHLDQSKILQKVAVRSVENFGAFAALRLIQVLKEWYDIVDNGTVSWFRDWAFNREASPCIFDAVPHDSSSGFNAFGYNYFLIARLTPGYHSVTLPFEIGKRLLISEAKGDSEAYFEWILPQMLFFRDSTLLETFPGNIWKVDRLIGAHGIEWHGHEPCPWDLLDYFLKETR